MNAGEKLGGYEVLAKLGEGGMGEVSPELVQQSVTTGLLAKRQA